MKVIMACRAVYPFHPFGGMQKYVYSLSKYLRKEGLDVNIVTSLDRSKKREKTHDGINYHFLPPMVNWRKFKAPWHLLFSINLARYLKKREFDVLHTYEMTGYAYLHLKSRVPTVVQPFGFEQFNDPDTLKMMKSFSKRVYIELLLRHPLRYCINKADKVALEGDFQQDMINKLSLKKEKIFELPVGVDIDSIKRNLENKTVSRQDLDLDDNDFVLISVNRLDPNKGIDYLIKSFAILKKEIDDTKLIIVGNGPEEEKMRGLVRNLKLTKDVKFFKNISEKSLYAYYSLSDVYVSPTLQDDFMMGILEAMVVGLPVVSTGQAFLVKHGTNGYVVPKRNPQVMAKALMKLYETEVCKKMGKKSEDFVKSYDFKNIAKIAVKTYKKLI